jgi:hypothetical protein
MRRELRPEPSQAYFKLECFKDSSLPAIISGGKTPPTEGTEQLLCELSPAPEPSAPRQRSSRIASSPAPARRRIARPTSALPPSAFRLHAIP